MGGEKECATNSVGAVMEGFQVEEWEKVVEAILGNNK